jgi:hypothetical protein
MRQGQQNRRGRGRGRKPQNPLARNYESNGPDVKIRGTAAHIAEKYMSLARDALASGDMVTAESYLQHAEHYNRIIMAAQSQFSSQPGQQGEGPNGGAYRPRWNADDEGGADDELEGGASSGGEVRQGGGEARQGGGRERGRHGGNGSEGLRDANGTESSEVKPSDENAPDPVS